MDTIIKFIKKHPNTTVTFDYDVEMDTYSVKVRDFDLNKAYTQKFHGVDFEDGTERITKYALNTVEKELYGL